MLEEIAFCLKVTFYLRNSNLAGRNSFMPESKGTFYLRNSSLTEEEIAFCLRNSFLPEKKLSA